LTFNILILSIKFFVIEAKERLQFEQRLHRYDILVPQPYLVKQASGEFIPLLLGISAVQSQAFRFS
jgi:hypothetical protein